MLCEPCPSACFIPQCSPHTPVLASHPSARLIPQCSPHTPVLASYPSACLIPQCSPHTPVLASYPSARLIPQCLPHTPVLASYPSARLIPQCSPHTPVPHTHATSYPSVPQCLPHTHAASIFLGPGSKANHLLLWLLGSVGQLLPFITYHSIKSFGSHQSKGNYQQCITHVIDT